MLTRPARRILPALLALLGGMTDANALGLGSPTQNPVVGHPLRIEIPLLLGPGESLPGPDCVRLTPPSDAPDKQFFPRRARAVINAAGRPRISIVSPDPVAEPLIEFRLSIGCGSSFARDFLVLSDVPSTPATSSSASSASSTAQRHATSPAPATAPTIEAPTIVREAEFARTKPATRTVPPRPAPLLSDIPSPGTTQTLRLSHDTTLNALARIRYPENQATRDEYRRLMAAANPELFAGATRLGSVPLPAGTVLVIPANLPPAERDAPAPQAKTETPTPAPATKQKPPQTESLSQRAAPEAGKRQDRLVIGGDARGGTPGVPALSPRELSGAIERMERMIEDQGRTEVEITENLKTLNSAFIELKNYIQTLEARVQQEEKARRALELKAETRPEPKALGILELLALILVGGASGAGLIVLHHRLTMQRLVLNRQSAEILTPEGQPPVEPPAHNVPESFEVPEFEPPAMRPMPARPSVAVPPAPTFTPPAPTVVPQPPAATAAPAAPVAAPVIPPQPPAPPPPAPARTPVPVIPPPAPPTPVPAPASISSLATVLDEPQRHDPLLDDPLEFDLDLPIHPVAKSADEPSAIPETRSAQAPTAAPIVFEPPMPALLRPGHEAVELADIMASMGLGKEAARSLVEHILSEPKQDLAPWLKAFDIYRETGQREEFEWLAENLRQHLNVQPLGWDDPYHGDTRSLVDFRHIAKRLVALWPTPECAAFLEELLLDNREGVRQGFPLTVAEEIVFLQQILRLRD